MQLELDDEESRTVLTALNRYGHSCYMLLDMLLDHALQKDTASPDGKPYTPEDIAALERCRDRAFAVQERLRKVRKEVSGEELSRL